MASILAQCQNNKAKQIDFNYLYSDEDDLVVERNPTNRIPLLPLFTLAFIYFLFIYVWPEFKKSQYDAETATRIEATTNTQDSAELALTGNIHQLVINGTADDIAQQLASLDKQAINSVVNGMTPIMLAASRGSVEIIDLLFTQGAEPNKRGSAKRTALQYATEKNHIEAAKRLLAYGADLDAYDNGRLTPLIMAADRGFTELGLLLLEKGANPNIQHSQGWTALIDAARNGDETFVNALLEAGANKDIALTNGMKARDIAKQYGHKKIIKILSK
jgi:ankyrin repeat protein